MHSPEILNLIQLLGRLPGLGPKSGRRIALHLLKKKEGALKPLLDAIDFAYQNVMTCTMCGNLDTASPCHICRDVKRESKVLCVVENVSDLWALERSKTFNGQYHVLGGVLSALDGVGPESLSIASLHSKLLDGIEEVVLSLGATVDGQTTLYYLANQLKTYPNLKITTLAHGVPIGGELDYLDDGTLSAAFLARRLVA
ncbi:MAG: recombination protein RecR [Proteobacteria bacterium]|nr:recombination protein RecR [Pseudomonadota bacterium]